MKPILPWQAVCFCRALALVAGLLLPLSGLRGAPVEGSRLRLPEYRTVKLENGITLLLLERHTLPLVSFEWIMKTGGSVGDPPDQEGLASLTADLLRKGTASRTANQISASLDFVGATWEASAAHDYASGSCEFVKKDLDLALDLFSDLLMYPSFPAEEVSKLVEQEADGIKEAKAVPGQVIGRYYDQFLFGAHPYGRPAGGTETSLRSLKREDVLKFYTSHYAPNELLFAAVGDFSAAELESKIKAKLGAWKPIPGSLPPLKEPAPVSGRRALIVEKPDATQTFFRFGNVGLAYANPDRVLVDVVNTLFGGRFTSMINRALRIDSGLTYGANSQFACKRVPGAFAVGTYTPNDKTERALNLALEVLQKVHQDGITPDQLKSAQAYIKGLYGLSLETNDQLAAMLCQLEAYGLGREYIDTYFDRIDAMTVADAKRIIDQYYPLKNLAFVFIGQPSVIEPVARKLADKVESKPITAPGF
ncbi:MAG: pitrilysin family protein [Verrucomicrobia bacterium]|nr:pitrilysin family protein [Verrucomicrobiota bacterium]